MSHTNGRALCLVLDQVLEPLGADTTGSQFLQPDGTFPNHIPNPENKEAMAAAVNMVKSSGDAHPHRRPKKLASG